jgi:hypothetical protein
MNYIVLFQGSSLDSRGRPGWEAVDALAGYLLSLDYTATALTADQEKRIEELFNRLLPQDQALPPNLRKSKSKNLPGAWRACRKPIGAQPGIQATER